MSQHQPKWLSFLNSINKIFPKYSENSHFTFKPKQMMCLDYMFEGKSVVAVLPTGFGKSLVFHLLPFVLPQKTSSGNIVLVICPLSSIIIDQMRDLKERGISVQFLQLEKRDTEFCKLFEENVSTTKTTGVPEIIKSGKLSILIGHPESFFCEDGRDLLKSKVYQDNVAAIVVDEAHCIEIWGEDFRTDFKKISSVRAFFPTVPVLALTATAPPIQIQNLKTDLCLRDCKIISVNPNRKNVFIKKVLRGTDKQFQSYEKILLPIAKKLKEMRTLYPMTIVYIKLKYCSESFKLFEQVLDSDQYAADDKNPTSRLFIQFHAPQTPRMKREILEEIFKEKSKIRVIFATTALGMGVNAPYVSQILHIRPPGTMDSYVQEIGRAGRRGQQSIAVLYYNNADVAANKKTVHDAIKEYCKNEENVCLRKSILQYFGYNREKQIMCCSVCDEVELDVVKFVEDGATRTISDTNLELLGTEIEKVLTEWREFEELTNYPMYNAPKIDDDLLERLLDAVPSIESENDMLLKFNIWNESVATKIFKEVEKYAPYS